LDVEVTVDGGVMRGGGEKNTIGELLGI